MKKRKYDANLIVIGAAVKARVILIEQGKMGGDCLNRGCIPSKSLIASARLLLQIKRSATTASNPLRRNLTPKTPWGGPNPSSPPASRPLSRPKGLTSVSATAPRRHGLDLNKNLGTVHAYPTWIAANKFAAGNWKREHARQWALNLLEKFHRWRRG